VTRVLPPHPWITAPQTAAVLDALEAAGGPDCARFVGGCVRNTLMGAEVADVDIATVLVPEAVIAALEAKGLRAIPTGVEHGTVTAVVDHEPYEITSLRRDVETDGRRAVVAFSTDWAEDAQRRDFRLNALYADRAGAIHDYVGGGVEDALAGRIVFVGDADTRIREDYLRILRFFRFFAWYGRGEPDAEGLAACARLREEVTSLSAERISKELLKLFEAPDPRPAAAFMAEAGVLERVVPAPLNFPRFEAMVALDPDPVLRLSALLPDDPRTVGRLAERLRLSNAQRDRLLAALPWETRVDLDLTAHEARAAVYRLGHAAFVDRVKRAWAEAPHEGARAGGLLALAAGWTRPRFPLGGADAMAAGVPRGPDVGRLLRAVEDWWVEQDFPEDGLQERLKAMAGAGA
jgi:poly(A) polymerase